MTGQQSDRFFQGTASDEKSGYGFDRRARLWLVTFFSLFAAACLFLSWRRPMWNDEIFTFYVAGQPTLHQLLAMLREGCDNQPPLYPLMVKMFRPLTATPELAVRLPSIAGFCVMCWSVFEFTRRRLPVAYAAVAMMIVCVACFYFATEGRSYGLGLGCSGLALLCWQRAAEFKPRAGALTGLFFCLSLAIALHYFFVFLLLPLLLAELVRAIQSRKPDWPMLGVILVPLWVLAAHFPLIAHVRPFPDALAPLSHLGAAYSYLIPGPIDPRILIPAPLLAAFAAWKLAPQSREGGPAFLLHEWIAVVSLAMLPVAIVAAVTVTHKLFLPRYALLANLGCAMLAAAVAYRVFRGSKYVPAGLILLSLALLGFRMARLSQSGDDLRCAVQIQRELTKMPVSSQPIVIVEPVAFVELSMYAPPDVKSRLVFALDPEQDRLAHGLYADAEQLGRLRHYVPLRVVDYSPSFLRTDAHFLVAANAEHWIVRSLRDAGYMVRQLPDLNPPLFQVDAPEVTLVPKHDIEPVSAGSAQDERWDAHWQSSGKWFLWCSAAIRRFVFQPAVAFYCDRFFSRSGLFVEMGCGTAQSSALIPRRERKLVGLDFSEAALGLALETGTLDALVRGDALNVPCRPGSIDGIWNLGVMEHFHPPEIQRCLAEFRRVLKDGGVLIMFWPAERNLSRWILAPVEWLKSLTSGQRFVFFPDEVSRLRSKEQAAGYLRDGGWELLAVDFSWRTASIHRVVVARKVS